MNPVYVLAHKKGCGIERMKQAQDGYVLKQGEPREIMYAEPHSFQRVWHERFNSDAHFVTYSYSGKDPIPRLRKNILQDPAFTAPPKIYLLPFDFDLPGHRSWQDDEEKESFLEIIEKRDEDYLGDWSVLYFTKHGFRLIYRLKKPIQPLQYDGVYLSLLQAWASAGIEFDTATKDWTRMFKLPGSTEAPPGIQVIQRDRELDNAQIAIPEVVQGPVATGARAEFVAIKPDPDSVAQILEDDRGLLNDLHQRLRLKARSIFLSEKPWSENGQRYSTMTSVVGSLCEVGASTPGITPEHIYSGLYLAAESMEPDEDGGSWESQVWQAIESFWVKQERQSQAQQSAVDRIIEALRARYPEYCGISRQQAWNMASRHAIAVLGNHYFPLRDDGTYSPHPVAQPMIVSHLRRDDTIHQLVSTYSTTQDGSIRDRSVTRIINDHAFSILGRQADVTAEGTGASLIYDVDTEGLYLRYNPFRLVTDVPTFSPEVDNWIAEFAGDHAEKLRLWIGFALSPELGPICGLHLRGGPGTGKDTLVKGLGSCFIGRSCANGSEISAEKRPSFLTSPIIHCEEGISQPRFTNGNVLGETFRRLISNNEQLIDAKYATPVMVRCHYRIVVTANNDRFLEQILRGAPTVEDTDAIAARVYDIQVDPEGHAARFFSKDTTVYNRWFYGPKLLVKHFLWLRAQALKHLESYGAPGSRFLVDGNSKRLMKQTLLQSNPSTNALVDLLVRLARQSSIDIKYGAWVEDDLWFCVSGLRRYQADMGLVPWPFKEFKRVLRHLSIQPHESSKSHVPGHPESPQTQWYIAPKARLFDLSENMEAFDG